MFTIKLTESQFNFFCSSNLTATVTYIFSSDITKSTIKSIQVGDQLSNFQISHML